MRIDKLSEALIGHDPCLESRAYLCKWKQKLFEYSNFLNDFDDINVDGIHVLDQVFEESGAVESGCVLFGDVQLKMSSMATFGV